MLSSQSGLWLAIENTLLFLARAAWFLIVALVMTMVALLAIAWFVLVFAFLLL